MGADGYNSGQGRAYLYHGGSSMDGSADLTLTGEAMDNYFGYSVASAGDVNGDGGENGREANCRVIATLECILEDSKAWASAPAG